MSRAHRPWVLPASILVALVLGLLPLPQVLQPLRPYWLALVVAYWVLESPDKAGLAIGALLVNDRVIAMALHLVLGVQPLPWSYWIAPLLGTLLWGPVYVALDALRVGAWRRR